LVSKVVTRSYTVTDDDVAAVADAGLSEDQIFEIAVCAAIGAADRQYAGGLAALTEAIGGRR
jgi:alkylhydroperoxidase/carboxymuconolactone decarboxylase family protein YurZ